MAKQKSKPSVSSQPSARQAGRAEPFRITWKQLGIGALVCLLAGGTWWYLGRPYLLVRHARKLIESDPVQAAALLDEALDGSLLSNPKNQLLWSRALLRSGRWDEALGCFSQITKPQELDGSALLELADDAAARNVSLLTVMALEAIPQDTPARTSAIQRLVEIRKREGDTESIEKLASEWALQDPDHPDPWRLMAAIHEQRMSLSEAVQDYRKWVDREKTPERRVEGLRSLVRTLIALGERDEARTRLTELSKISSSPQLIDQLYDAQLKRLEGDIEGAWSGVNQVLRVEPSHLTALELRGTLAMDRADPGSAVEDFEKVLRVQPWSQQAQYKISQCLTRLGRTAEALPHLEESRRLLKFSNRILELIGKENLTNEETDELVNAFEQTGLKTAAERWRQVRRP
jgi:tetratricopeptide (TPR) repeat protein